MAIPITRATVGGAITAGMYNQLVDSFNPPLARAVKSSAQNTSGTVNTNTAVQYNQNSYDSYNMHSTVTNTSRMTVPGGWGGYYRATGRVRLVAGTASLTIQFAVNGVVQTETATKTFGAGPTVSGAFGQAMDDFLLSPGDYVEVFVQSDTASQALVPGNCMFSLSFIHP